MVSRVVYYIYIYIELVFLLGMDYALLFFGGDYDEEGNPEKNMKKIQTRSTLLPSVWILVVLPGFTNLDLCLISIQQPWLDRKVRNLEIWGKSHLSHSKKTLSGIFLEAAKKQQSPTFSPWIEGKITWGEWPMRWMRIFFTFHRYWPISYSNDRLVIWSLSLQRSPASSKSTISSVYRWEKWLVAVT